ncbi:3-keto-5-aminohexanoate cleavage protein [Pseudomonas sp. P9_31]|uniref:3-keto-5-aminohexanoate cleavage protein n=1 Tax=Pseudomonas sp. P9_31 TaxID=3043448 RepID=UPI002A363ABF|nr:3-keto-5-aminohexanoate cleavage protein [Pseudomonas sp. P9_31]WPN55374.1 3-keto-5-aminohexanoate cleavage protein [Pseudomonas sp. P9_31]
MSNPQKTLILGCASTGAKFTPRNHYLTGDQLLDSICTGATIKGDQDAIVKEAIELYNLGCRYYHYHARNPITQEQTTDNDIYQAVSRNIQRSCKDVLLSFGASRNGKEVQENIKTFGEWERVSQCALPLHFGGAHFVTIQAAIELQIICELEKKIQKLDFEYMHSSAFFEDIQKYVPSARVVQATMETNSTSKGADYGSTSPSIQFQVYRSAISARRQLGLFHEVEWVQLARSYGMTRFAVEHPSLQLGSSGQLNIILLFGFSSRLPFPSSYDEFCNVIEVAKSLEFDISNPDYRKRKITITVGAAIIPQQAHLHYKVVDVGPRKGTEMCALRRLATYACQPGSGVDILRVGMEDTPYGVDEKGQVHMSDNQQLMEYALEEIGYNGVTPELNPETIINRMGLDIVRDEHLTTLRQRPLGVSENDGAFQ